MIKFVTIRENKELKMRLGDLLIENGLSQREFSKMSGIRQATINEIANNKKNSIHFDHLLRIMITLELESFDSVFEIVEVEVLAES